MERKLPQHVAIIMDGNGRWAEKRGLPRMEGHKAGIGPVKKIIRSCLKKHIPCLSLFAFSSENWLRPTEEVDFLMNLFLVSIRNELPELNANGIKMRFTGDRSILNSSLQAQMRAAEQETSANKNLILNLVVNYGGKWDLLSAAKKMAQAALNGSLNLDQVGEEEFAAFLDTAGLPDPDLFIRTSGELRISNFFLWQLAYTELYFATVHWPDFDEHEFDLALDSFKERKRRFGQIAAVDQE